MIDGSAAARIAAITLVALLAVTASDAPLGARRLAQDADQQGEARFKGGIDLVNVTATVTDPDGHFVPGLGRDDFTVYDNGSPQTITQFSNDPVPVSLGLLIDVSGSMTPDKMAAARGAIRRISATLLENETHLIGGANEMFVMAFAARSRVLQNWTTDGKAIERALDGLSGGGGTAMYDAVADALPVVARGRNQKKALLVISDGNDSTSSIRVEKLRQAIRESDVLVYALGVDASESTTRVAPRVPSKPRFPFPPLPRFPQPGGRPWPGGRLPRQLPLSHSLRNSQVIGGGSWGSTQRVERVNAEALRKMTDDSGGRTEIVRGFDDLDGAVTRIADELNRQYYLGYASPAQKDGTWHAIEVKVRDSRLIVRARRGYIAS